MADTKGGSSIGFDKFNKAKDAQKFIKDKIKNNSAIIDNFLPAIQKLKEVTGNPKAIDSIGAGNYSAIKSQLAKHFAPEEVKVTEPGATPCDMLFKIPFAMLTPIQAEQRKLCLDDCPALHRALPENLSAEETAEKALCEVVQQHLEADLQAELSGEIANTEPIISNANTEFENPESGLSLTLVAMSELTALKSFELNSNLSGNTVIGGNVSVAGLATFGNSTVNSTVNSSFIMVGNSTVNATVNSTSFALNGVSVGSVARGTVSGATLDIPLAPFSSMFGVRFMLSLLPGTNSQELWMRFSTDGGSSYVASGYNYTVDPSINVVEGVGMCNTAPPTTNTVFNGQVSGLQTIPNASDSKLIMTGNTIGNVVSHGVNLIVDLINFANSTMYPRAHWSGYGIQSGGTGFNFAGGGALAVAQNTDAVRFMFATGTIIGTYAVYGY